MDNFDASSSLVVCRRWMRPVGAEGLENEPVRLETVAGASVEWHLHAVG